MRRNGRDAPFWSLGDDAALFFCRALNALGLMPVSVTSVWGTWTEESSLWETPAGKQVSITSRRLVSLANRHVGAISYRVRLLNVAASLVISSEMSANQPSTYVNANDPRQTRVFAAPILH